MIHVTGQVTGNMDRFVALHDGTFRLLFQTLAHSACLPFVKAPCMPRSQVTIRDVAKKAGVSHQTVSRVINASAHVLPETRARVEQAIQDLGYRPNAIARFMAQGRTRTLACISPNLSDYTFAKIIEGAETQARAAGYLLLTASAADGQVFAELVSQLVDSRRTEGLLIINPYLDDRHTHTPSDFPVVYLAAAPRDPAILSVSLDDHAGGRDATQHLLDLGHRQIAMITGPEIEDCTNDRTAGYQAALEGSGLTFDPGLVRQGDWSATSGYEAVYSLMESGAVFSGVFAQNDRMAAGAARALREAGLAVPEHVSIIGFDDMPLASYFDPPLTTMRQDLELLGQEAADLLIGMIEEKPIGENQRLLPATLIVRNSTQLR